MMQIKNEYDAFVKALVLAIEAPTGRKMRSKPQSLPRALPKILVIHTSN